MTEIKLVPTASKSIPTIERTLNKLTADGWTVITSFPLDTGSGAVLVLQRVTFHQNLSFFTGLNKLKDEPK